MPLTQPAIEFLQRRVPPAAETPLGVVVAVAVGGVVAGMPFTDMLICGLVAGGGVALFCAVAAWLFDAPMGPGLLGLWDDSGELRPLRFRRSRHVGRPVPAHPAIRVKRGELPGTANGPPDRRARSWLALGRTR